MRLATTSAAAESASRATFEQDALDGLLGAASIHGLMSMPAAVSWTPRRSHNARMCFIEGDAALPLVSRLLWQ